jgi:hypothetical protein
MVRWNIDYVDKIKQVDRSSSGGVLILQAMTSAGG